MNHLHPMIVHFPIALALVALLFNATWYVLKREWMKTGSVALTVLAALGAVGAILTGLFFTKPVAGLAATMKDTHIVYASTATVMLLIAAVVGLMLEFGKKPAARNRTYLYTLFLLLSAVAISMTGMVGGSIVYDIWLF